MYSLIVLFLICRKEEGCSARAKDSKLTWFDCGKNLGLTTSTTSARNCPRLHVHSVVMHYRNTSPVSQPRQALHRSKLSVLTSYQDITTDHWH